MGTLYRMRCNKTELFRDDDFTEPNSTHLQCCPLEWMEQNWLLSTGCSSTSADDRTNPEWSSEPLRVHEPFTLARITKSVDLPLWMRGVGYGKTVPSAWLGLVHGHEQRRWFVLGTTQWRDIVYNNATNWSRLAADVTSECSSVLWGVPLNIGIRVKPWTANERYGGRILSCEPVHPAGSASLPSFTSQLTQFKSVAQFTTTALRHWTEIGPTYYL